MSDTTKCLIEQVLTLNYHKTMPFMESGICRVNSDDEIGCLYWLCSCKCIAKAAYMHLTSLCNGIDKWTEKTNSFVLT